MTKYFKMLFPCQSRMLTPTFCQLNDTNALCFFPYVCILKFLFIQNIICLHFLCFQYCTFLSQLFPVFFMSLLYMILFRCSLNKLAAIFPWHILCQRTTKERSFFVTLHCLQTPSSRPVRLSTRLRHGRTFRS